MLHETPEDSLTSANAGKKVGKENADGDSVVRVRGCPLCGSARFTPLPAPHRFIGPAIFEPFRAQLGLSACRDCDFVFTNPRPARALLDRFYGGVNQPRENVEIARGGASAKAEFFLAYMEERAKGRRLLEYGCADGTLLEEAVKRGWEARGFDTDQALSRCRALGLDATDDLATLQKGAFDAVLLKGVYEHLEERDEVLASLKPLLAGGGKLFVQVPNAASLRARLAAPLLSKRGPVADRYTAFPIHLSYFTPRTLPRFIARNGFAVEEVRTFGLGLGELLVEKEKSAPPTGMVREPPARSAGKIAPPPSWKSEAKVLVKDLFFKSGLGEQLMVMASLRERT